MHPLLLLALPAALAAVLVFLKPYAWYLALCLLSLVAAKRSQIDAWAESQPRLAGLLKLLRAAGFDPWLAVQGLTLIVKGRLPAAVKAGSKSIAPPPLAALALACVLALGALGCSGAAKLTPKQEVDLLVDAAPLACHKYLGQGKERDPALDEFCARILGDSGPTLTTDTTPDAGSSDGGKPAE